MKLHTQIFGEGNALVILHGFLGMGDNWKSLAKKYARSDFEVHLPDLRNHGKSPHDKAFNYTVMAEDLHQYFKTHDIKDAVLIGHSMGGKVAMHFASMYAKLINHLIVVDISPKLYKPHHDDILSSLKILQSKKLTSRKNAEEILKTKIKEKGIRLFLLKNLKREKDNNLSVKPNIDIFIENKQEIGKPLPEKFEYQGPTLFVKGEHSDYITNDDKHLISNHFPNYETIVIPNAGHWVHAENPKHFFDKTMNFIKN